MTSPTATLAGALFGLVCCWAPEARSGPAGADLAAEGPPWRFSGPIAPGATLRLDFVRADITIEPATGRDVDVLATVADVPEAARARVVALSEGGDVRILDVFPSPPLLAPSSECLPPLDEHGDIWNHVVRFTVTVRAPVGQPIRATVRNGLVRDLRPGSPAGSAATGAAGAGLEHR